VKTLMIVAAVATLTTFAASASAQQINCHRDPVCQAKRDGVSVAEARRRDRCMGGLPADRFPDKAAKCGIVVRR
jgi:hypothetical protein